MRTCWVLPVALLAACSSGSGTPELSSPQPLLPTTAAPSASTAAPAVPATTALTAAPRRTASPSPSPSASRTPSPTPSPRPSPQPSPTRAGKTVAVDQVTGYRFSPSTVSLRSGDGVLVTNKDVATHTFTVDALGVDSGSMAQGDTFRYVFRAPGRYTFYCRPHESLGMTGTLTVTP